jgi:hypothetical protein
MGRHEGACVPSNAIFCGHDRVRSDTLFRQDHHLLDDLLISYSVLAEGLKRMNYKPASAKGRFESAVWAFVGCDEKRDPLSPLATLRIVKHYPPENYVIGALSDRCRNGKSLGA